MGHLYLLGIVMNLIVGAAVIVYFFQMAKSFPYPFLIPMAWHLILFNTALVILLFFEGDFAQFFESLMSDLARWSVYILSPGLIVGTLYGFYRTRRRKLISTSTLVGAACLFPIAVVSLYVFLWWFEAIRGWPSTMEGLIIIGAATGPFIPLVTVPLFMAKQRHR